MKGIFSYEVYLIHDWYANLFSLRNSEIYLADPSRFPSAVSTYFITCSGIKVLVTRLSPPITSWKLPNFVLQTM